MNNYSVSYVSYKPWSVIWIYDSGRKVAKYKYCSEKEYKRIKVRKDWKCEVCDCDINKGDEAYVIYGNYNLNYYTHVHCIDIMSR